MSESLPGQAPPVGPPADDPAPRGQNRGRDAIVNAAAGVALRALPRIPNAVKRLLLGGRSVTVDGNTLDTTLQLMLAGQRATGIDGLVSSDDVHVARAQLRILAASVKQDIPVAAVTNLSIPGPAGPIPARHYQPAHADGPLLVFFHGGGWVIGDLETHDDLCRLICRDGRIHVLSVDYRLAPEHKAPAAAVDAFAAYQWALEHAGSSVLMPTSLRSAVTARVATSPRWFRSRPATTAPGYRRTAADLPTHELRAKRGRSRCSPKAIS